MSLRDLNEFAAELPYALRAQSSPNLEPTPPDDRAVHRCARG